MFTSVHIQEVFFQVVWQAWLTDTHQIPVPIPLIPCSYAQTNYQLITCTCYTRDLRDIASQVINRLVPGYFALDDTFISLRILWRCYNIKSRLNLENIGNVCNRTYRLVPVPSGRAKHTTLGTGTSLPNLVWTNVADNCRNIKFCHNIDVISDITFTSISLLI